MSPCVAGDHLFHRAPHDLKVQLQRGIFNVSQITFETIVHVLGIQVAPAIAGNLCPSGQTGTGVVIAHIETGDLTLPIPAFLTGNGRGPTRLISPLSTLISCGNSSMFVFLRNLPKAKMRQSPFFVTTGLPSTGFTSLMYIVLNLKQGNSLPFHSSPALGEYNRSFG